MNGLPLYLLDEILFRLEPRSLAMIQCTNKYFKSHISNNPNFEIEYSSRIGPCLIGLSRNELYCYPFVSSCISMSSGKRAYLSDHGCYILGSCSGLLLLYIGGFFVVNPLTKRFRLIDESGSKLIPILCGPTMYPGGFRCVAFAVERNRPTKRFNIVCIHEMHTRYEFEISDGDSWRLSKATITTGSESRFARFRNPVYLDGTFHWLRLDGSIIAFNPETEQACFIPSSVHWTVQNQLFLAADEEINRLTLISVTKETISIYTLKNSKWALAREIKINVSMEESTLFSWNLVAYDGKRLVGWEMKKGLLDYVVHVYDMEANSWGVLWSTTGTGVWGLEFLKFTPSLFSVGEDEHNYKAIVASNDLRISNLSAVMRVIDTTK